MGTKTQRAVYESVNISDDLVYEWVNFFKDQVYEWGRFRNTGSHTRTKITPSYHHRVLTHQVLDWHNHIHWNLIRLDMTW